MPDYGEVAFTLDSIKVAALGSDNTYGTAVSLDYAQKLEFKPEADTDQIKARGMLAELLAVITHGTGTLDEGMIDFGAYLVLAGYGKTEYGVTPNRYSRFQVLVGAGGLPYFGLIGKLFGVAGADIHIGFPKCMLDTFPGFTIEQNKFVIPTSAIKMITPDLDARKLATYDAHETATTVTDDFDTFFADCFS